MTPEYGKTPDCQQPARHTNSSQSPFNSDNIFNRGNIPRVRFPVRTSKPVSTRLAGVIEQQRRIEVPMLRGTIRKSFSPELNEGAGLRTTSNSRGVARRVLSANEKTPAAPRDGTS